MSIFPQKKETQCAFQIDHFNDSLVPKMRCNYLFVMVKMHSLAYSEKLPQLYIFDDKGSMTPISQKNHPSLFSVINS